MTSVIAPPEPPRQEDVQTPNDLEALIEEARRRTRLRRLSYATAVLLAVLVGVAVWGGIALTNDSTTNGAAPPGFQLVQARGPVEHQVIQTRGLLRLSTVDLATGRERPTKRTSELWVDPRGRLARVVVRLDGRKRTDQVVPCNPTRYGSCALGFSFAFNSPIDSQNYVRDPGTYRFHGRKVIWAGRPYPKGFPPAPGLGERVGIDVRTHEPIAYRYLEDGEVAGESWVKTRLRNLPADRFYFAVPDGGIEDGFPKLSATQAAVSPERGLLEARARRALRRTPLWLGRMFEGQPLRSIALGVEILKAKSGVKLSTARFVRYDYGGILLQEYGARHPSWYRQGPRPGHVVLERGRDYGGQADTPVAGATVQWAALTRNGVLVLASPSGPFAASSGLTRAGVLRLVDALRPVPR
jgi:hypothetical protein